MSISGKQQINVGQPNESINSDSLYTAFTKTQQNFDTLFTCASPFTNFVGGTSISTASNATTGTVTITNTGVTSIVAGTNIVIDQSNGEVTISSTGGGGGGGGTVTSVGLAPISSGRLVVTNSPIISAGNINIDLAVSGVLAGTYANPNVTVDTYGRITTISSGSVPGTVTSVGLTAGPGVQVNGGPVTTSGSIIVTNTGVIKLTAGNGIDLSGPNGNITIALAGGINGTVTSVGISSTSLVISGGPVTTSGIITVDLPANPIITGTLTAANSNLGLIANASYFSGDGSNLTNLSAANITGTVSTAATAGTVTTNAQPNITSVGTLTSLAVVASANPSLGNNVTANFFTGSGQNLSSIQASNIVGTVTSASNATNVSTTLVATGTYYLPFISATASSNYSLNSNAAFSANLANGAIIATTFVGALSGAATTAGTVTTAAQPSITSVGTLTSLTVSGSANFATASGNVGIGTSTPGAKLEVAGGTVGTTAGDLLNVTVDRGLAGSNNVSVRTSLVRVTTGTDWTTTAMRLQGRVDVTDFGYIDLVSNGTHGIAFGSGTAERMRIDASGNVGIGTNAPGAKFGVAGSGQFVDTIYCFTGVTSGAVQGQFAANESGTVDVRAVSNHPMLFYTNNAERMRIDASGNVGIGTATPAGLLQVVAGPNSSLIFRGPITYSEGGSIFAVNSENSVIKPLEFAASTFYFNDGNVGIGTSTPVYKLQVQGASGTAYAAVNTTSGTDKRTGVVFLAGNTPQYEIGVDASFDNTKNFYIYDAVSASMRFNIDSAGNVGIGNAAPAHTLSVTGTTNISGNANVGNLGTAGLIVATGNVTGGNLVTGGALSVTGNASLANVNMSGYVVRSINAAISAAGTNQGTATALTKEINVISTVTAGQGVVLPTAVAGMVLIINNTSANTVNVYPASGAAINSSATNIAYSHVSGASLQYYATSSTQWYTVGASYV